MANLLSHIYQVVPEMRTKLSRAQRSIAAWKKIIPHSPSLPFTKHIMLAIVATLSEKKQLHTAIALATAWGVSSRFWNIDAQTSAMSQCQVMYAWPDLEILMSLASAQTTPKPATISSLSSGIQMYLQYSLVTQIAVRVGDCSTFHAVPTSRR